MKTEQKRNLVERSCTLSDVCFQGTAFSLKKSEVEIDMYQVDYY